MTGLEREIQLAQRQIDMERNKQEELVRERERCASCIVLPGMSNALRFITILLLLLLRHNSGSVTVWHADVGPLTGAQVEQGTHHC